MRWDVVKPGSRCPPLSSGLTTETAFSKDQTWGSHRATHQPQCALSIPGSSSVLLLALLGAPGLSFISPIALCILTCTGTHSLHTSPCNLN